jgi:ribosome-dependent ATPase
VASLEGASAVIGQLYPTTHFLLICRGVFSKALGLADLYPYFLALLATLPVLGGLSLVALGKQEK